MSTADIVKKHLARALDELARGDALRLHTDADSLVFRAAEYGGATGLCRVVLAPTRAKFLGISEGAVVEAQQLPALLFGKHPPAIGEHFTPSALERHAVVLVKRAGLLPAILHAEADESVLVLDAAAVQNVPATVPELTLQTTIHLPMHAAENTRVAAFMERGGRVHLAILIGAPEQMEAPTVRLHSSCLTGDILGSLRCDCGEQLSAAMHSMAENGGGVVLYLNQEGRGIGLMGKLRAYALQEQGMDTVEANLALGYGEDERDFSIAAIMLKALGMKTIRLMTNNPAKMAALSACGVVITERIPLVVEAGAHNREYLASKVAKLGHIF